MLSELVYKLQRVVSKVQPLRALDICPRDIESKGDVLVSYVPLPLIGDAANFRGHSNVWECAEIVSIFNRLGYSVDLISWNDTVFKPCKEYTAVFDIHRNLMRYLGPETRALFHMTGGNPLYSNQSELNRLEALKDRRGVMLTPRRVMDDDNIKLFFENAWRADVITLIGNEVTTTTYPKDIQSKICKINPTGAYIGFNGSLARKFSAGREFLWFNGSGAIHKGLDLVLEVFAKHPEWTLHIVGPYLNEKDFSQLYKKELFYTPNICSHGFIYPSSRRFKSILDRVCAFINPACSEGVSTSAITCMQLGLIPIVSRQSGISLIHGMGYVLSVSSKDEIELAVSDICKMSLNELNDMSYAIQRFALSMYSRDEFSRQMTAAIKGLLV